MAGLSEQLKERLRAQSAAAREPATGGRTAPYWDLTGKKAVVAPGASAVFRLLPRWDYADRFIEADGKWVENPQYVEDFCFFIALEHWWDGPDGKPNRVWCLRSFDAEAPCPVCEGAAELLESPDAEERKHGKRIVARKAYLFNAVMGGNTRAVTESGDVDVRVLAVGNSLFVPIVNFMTGAGGEDEDTEQFSYGDITDVVEGHNILLTRPGSDGERWAAKCAPTKSPLFGDAQAAFWDTFASKLINLPDMVQREMLPYEVLFKRYYGEDVAPAKGAVAEALEGAWGEGPTPTPPVRTSAAPPFTPPGRAPVAATPAAPSTPKTPAAPPAPKTPAAPRGAPRRPSGRG